MKNTTGKFREVYAWTGFGKFKCSKEAVSGFLCNLPSFTESKYSGLFREAFAFLPLQVQSRKWLRSYPVT